MTNGADFALLEQYVFRHRWIDKNHRNVIMMDIFLEFEKGYNLLKGGCHICITFSRGLWPILKFWQYVPNN